MSRSKGRRDPSFTLHSRKARGLQCSSRCGALSRIPLPSFPLRRVRSGASTATYLWLIPARCRTCSRIGPATKVRDVAPLDLRRAGNGLATIGLYGVISFSVTQRTKEIGIRMALGGQRSDVLRLVLRQSGRLALVGILLGLPIAFAATRLLGTTLYGVGVTDPVPISWSSHSSAWPHFLPSSIPALRASRVDRIVALHHE